MEILRFFLGFLRYFRDIWDCLSRFLKLFSNLFQDFKISLEIFKILRLFWRFLICLRCFSKILRFWLRFLRFLWRFQGFFEILFLEILRKFYQIFSSYLPLDQDVVMDTAYRIRKFKNVAQWSFLANIHIFYKNVRERIGAKNFLNFWGFRAKNFPTIF